MIVKCPSCRRELVWESSPYRPFCSERCQLIDRGRWASGEYFIADESPSEAERDDSSNDLLPSDKA